MSVMNGGLINKSKKVGFTIDESLLDNPRSSAGGEVDGDELYIVEGARCATQEYVASVEDGFERSDFVKHGERVAGLLSAFVGSEVPQAAIASAFMHDLSERALNTNNPRYNEERAEAARITLLNFLTDPRLSDEETTYISELLRDMLLVDGAAGEHRCRMADHSTNRGKPLDPQIQKMLKSRYRGGIPSEAWATIEPMIDPEHISGFLKQVNLESVLIKACEVLDNLIYPSSDRESARLQDLMEAESFYSPLCEVLGYEALAAALSNEAKRIRLEKQGKIDSLAEAEDFVRAISTLDTSKLIGAALGASGAMDYVSVVGVDSAGKFPVCMGEVPVGNDNDLRVKFRIKSVGSLANKIDGSKKRNGDNYMPMDILGITVISNDEESSAISFATFLAEDILRRGSDSASSIILKAAPSKQRAIHIQGTESYVETVCCQLDKLGIDPDLYACKMESADDIERRGVKRLEVAKVTYLLRQTLDEDDTSVIYVPTEVQFITKAERERMRLGDIAHVIYKSFNQTNYTFDEQKEARRQFIELMTTIYGRKSRLNPNSLDTNGQSDVRGHEFTEWLTQ